MGTRFVALERMLIPTQSLACLQQNLSGCEPLAAPHPARQLVERGRARSVHRSFPKTAPVVGARVFTHAINKKVLCVRLWKGTCFCRRVLRQTCPQYPTWLFGINLTLKDKGVLDRHEHRQLIELDQRFAEALSLSALTRCLHIWNTWLRSDDHMSHDLQSRSNLHHQDPT